MLGLLQIARSHIDLQQVLFPGPRHDGLLAAYQLARDQRKQVAGFAMWIYPAREVPSLVAFTGQIAVLDQIAVGQQHRVARLVGAQRHAVARHHIRAIKKIGDAAKSFGLALGEERVVADVQSHQLAVLGRGAGGEYFYLEVARRRQIVQHQLAAVYLE